MLHTVSNNIHHNICSVVNLICKAIEITKPISTPQQGLLKWKKYIEMNKKIMLSTHTTWVFANCDK